MKKLENKIVFITGSNSGIGKASALEAAREGATIVVAYLEKIITNKPNAFVPQRK